MPKLDHLILTGSAYKNGRRVAGWSMAYVSNEQVPRYYPEEVTMEQILRDLEAEGIDCSRTRKFWGGEDTRSTSIKI